jgi:hypothetical protein
MSIELICQARMNHIQKAAWFTNAEILEKCELLSRPVERFQYRRSCAAIVYRTSTVRREVRGYVSYVFYLLKNTFVFLTYFISSHAYARTLVRRVKQH